MNVFERAVDLDTYTNALEDPGSAIKNVVSDPAFGLVAGMALGPAGYGLSSGYAALMAGGISALATGSLKKGFMTGLSAYGGAGLSDSFMKAGASDLAANAVHEGAIGGQTAGFGNQALQYPSVANASALDKISAGFGAATSSSDAALQFAKDNYGKALMAAGPVLADQMVQTKTPLPTAGSLSGPSYIRPYSMTRKVRQPEKDSGSREQDWFETTWERGTPYKAANGGIVALAGGGTTSQDAYDFLMGKKSNTGPVVNTVTQAPTYEGRYEYDPITGTSRFVPRVDMTTALKPTIPATTTTTPTTDTTGITTLVPGFGNPNAAAITAASFDAMTPAQKAQHQAVMANLSDALTPMAVKIFKQLKDKFLYKNPNETPAEVVNMDSLSDAAIAQSNAANAAANSAQGIAAANAAAAVGAANAAGNAGSAGTSAGPGGMAGTVGGPGVAASVSAGNVGAASAAGPGSSGVGVGGGGGGNGSGGSSAGGSSAGSAYSDVRMKDNIKPIGNALSKVKKLDGITYDMAGKRGAGLAAQQVEKVLPEVVHKDGKGMRKLDYGNTVGLLVEAVKELDAKKKAGGGMLQGYATGGLSDLGSYSDGGRLLRGPGDGVSDSIPAMIGKNQPARLADGEFVVPARIVSEIGNGSTEAGARKLYAMMDRIQAARRKTVGKGKVAANTKTDKYLPA